ncbi:MAG: GDP-L-fucose synthase [Hydrogenophilales bacterium]
MEKFSLDNLKVWVPGSNGMVSSAIIKKLKTENCKIITSTRNQLDLTDKVKVFEFYKSNQPDVVILSAAKVGGIHANNTYPVDFLLENLFIQNNIISGAHNFSVKKLLFLGSSCIYPKNINDPISEDHLLTGSLEETNEWYAVAKISGIKLCQAYQKQYNSNFISAMPTNLYGPNDNFHPLNSHVPAALLLKFHNAKINDEPFVTVWGSGNPKREFLYVDDLADACLYLLKNYNGIQPINVGTGEDISIKDFAAKIKNIVGYKGELKFDKSKPDGTMRKRLNISRLNNLGWKYKVSLDQGLKLFYEWFSENVNV